MTLLSVLKQEPHRQQPDDRRVVDDMEWSTGHVGHVGIMIAVL